MKGRIITNADCTERIAVVYRAVISIRSATVDDVAEVLAFWAEATVEPSATDDPDSVVALLRAAPGALLLAVDDDGATSTIVGTVIASWDGWRGAMYRLAVSPSMRRQGIATRLVTEGERRVREQGARRFHLIVLEEEAPAQAFWTAVGYEH